MKRSEAFPSNYLSKEDCTPPIIATIASLGRKTLKSDDGDETKTVMNFREEQYKPLILNNTNWLICEDAFGEDSDSWLGKKIELYNDPTVMFGKDRKGGIRIRIPQAVAAGPLTFDQAVALCATVGISKETLIATLKANGKTGYVPARDTDEVVQLVEDMRAAVANKEEAF